MIENNINLQQIEDGFLLSKNIKLYILREDLIHPTISGNKWRKLKYNVLAAKANDFNTLLTFGGAYSNHIAATAAAGKEFGLKTIGIIRGEKVSNSTLDLALSNGMELNFVSRNDYKEKDVSQYPNAYILPEGGSNQLAVKGCAEIVNNIKIDYDIICCPCGTGGTIAGIITASEKKVLGFSALKGGDFLVENIKQLLRGYNGNKDYHNWELITNYHFGGYAKVKTALVDFVKAFKEEHDIVLDLVYTGKMLYGLYDLIKNSEEYNGKTIVVVHTGGIQGNKGFEERLGITI